MRLRYLAFVLLAFFVSACGHSTPAGVITSFGEFPSPDGSRVLKIEKKSTSLVVGSILDSARGTLFSEEIGSDASRWCFYWSAEGSLWVFSSDTGFLKQITAQGSARSISRGEKLPAAVFEFLPASLREVYAK
jgi:hypothetical protein